MVLALLLFLFRWDSLTADQKATLVVDCMRYGCEIMKAMFDIASDVDSAFISGQWGWKMSKAFRNACAKLGIKEGKFAKKLYAHMGCKLS